MSNTSLLSSAAAIAESLYAAAATIGAEFPDEQWRTASKLLGAANDAYFYVAQVEGAGLGQSLDFDCVNARKQLQAARAMYIFAAKQGMIELEPKLVVQIDELIKQVDRQQELAKQESKRKAGEELRPWLEKYRIWQQISKS